VTYGGDHVLYDSLLYGMLYARLVRTQLLDLSNERLKRIRVTLTHHNYCRDGNAIT